MQSKYFMKPSFLATSLLILSGSVQAAPITFFGEDISTAGTALGANSAAARSNFLSNLSGVGNEDFESFSVGDSSPLALSFPGSSGSITSNLTGGGSISNFTDFGRFATSGSNYWEAQTGNFSINFSSGISAFGFNGIDIGDFVPETLKLTLTETGGATSILDVAHSLGIGNFDNATLFFGFFDTTTTYTSISFNNAGGGDIFGFDDMVIGDREQVKPNPVPEPASLVLIGLGIAGLRFQYRKVKA